MTTVAPAIHSYYDFEVSLQDIEPRIWRRFLLTTSGSLYDLHRAIQDAGGWNDYHLFEFRTRVTLMDPTLPGFPFEEEPEDRIVRVKAAKLKDDFGSSGNARWVYVYDFGDNWQVEIKCHGTVSLPYKFKRALMAGERAFPPEDCGGVGGYERLVKFRKTGVDEWGEEDTLGDWLGRWQPEGFDLRVSKKRFDR